MLDTVYVFLVGPLFFSLNEAKLSELAERDIAAAGAGEVSFSAEFDALYRRTTFVANGSITLIAVAVFFMTVKP